MGVLNSFLGGLFSTPGKAVVAGAGIVGLVGVAGAAFVPLLKGVNPALYTVLMSAAPLYQAVEAYLANKNKVDTPAPVVNDATGAVEDIPDLPPPPQAGV